MQWNWFREALIRFQFNELVTMNWKHSKILSRANVYQLNSATNVFKFLAEQMNLKLDAKIFMELQKISHANGKKPLPRRMNPDKRHLRFRTRPQHECVNLYLHFQEYAWLYKSENCNENGRKHWTRLFSVVYDAVWSLTNENCIPFLRCKWFYNLQL